MRSSECFSQAVRLLRSHGIPRPKLKGRGLEKKLVPLGELDLDEFGRMHPDLDLSVFKQILFEGFSRNEEFKVTYMPKVEQEDLPEVFHQINQRIVDVLKEATQILSQGQLVD